RRFTDGAREAIASNDRSSTTMEALSSMHQDVARRVQDLVAATTQRALQTDHELAGRSRELADESVPLLGACFLLALISATLTIQLTRSSVERVEWQAGELGRISWHMLQSQEQAARRFSHELHDELGQSLAAIKANLAGLSPSNLEARRSDCMGLVDEAIANVRELSQLLRPVILDDFGLDAALAWLTEKFSQRTNIPVQYDSNLPTRLDEESETHLFRIAQEALTNIARHSQATQVRMSLECIGDRVELTIEDNGRGFTIGERVPATSLGMVGMRARARQAGGELTVSSGKSGGVRILVQIPAQTLSL
ncbi:MAG TPA: sensor histidine kinase, partial [Bryobacteraceae bacterium]|nr:sensor histidine kinase [Bryobacteraceae bacterium]